MKLTATSATLLLILLTAGALIGQPAPGPATPAAPPAAAAAAPAAAPYTVEFLADESWTWDGWTEGVPFICLADSSGATAGCFSFYGKDQGKMTVFGPGCDKTANGGLKEATLDPSHRPAVNAGKYPVTEAQYKRILRIGVMWNKKSFVLGRCDCVAFANQVARAAKLHAPDLASAMKPADYVTALSKLNPR
jgi:hypothetical protein